MHTMIEGTELTLEELLAETPVLLAYSTARLKDHQEAEELVQDCLLAAWNQRERFAGRSSLRTWLIGILRHKLLDRLRARQRRPDHISRAQSLDTEDAQEDPSAAWFTPHGSWRIDPTYAMGALAECPRNATLRSELKQLLRLCADALPDTLRRLFSFRELDHCETTEAARLAGVSNASAPVLLSRARLQMRDCLQQRLSR